MRNEREVQVVFISFWKRLREAQDVLDDEWVRFFFYWHWICFWCCRSSATEVLQWCCSGAALRLQCCNGGAEVKPQSSNSKRIIFEHSYSSRVPSHHNSVTRATTHGSSCGTQHLPESPEFPHVAQHPQTERCQIIVVERQNLHILRNGRNGSGSLIEIEILTRIDSFIHIQIHEIKTNLAE